MTQRQNARDVDFKTSIPFLITSLANKLSAISSRRLRKRFGVGLMEWRTIVLLGAETTATPGRVAEVAGVDKSVVSRAVTTLERARPDRDLRRRPAGPPDGDAPDPRGTGAAR